MFGKKKEGNERKVITKDLKNGVVITMEKNVGLWRVGTAINAQINSYHITNDTEAEILFKKLEEKYRKLDISQLVEMMS